MPSRRIEDLWLPLQTKAITFLDLTNSAGHVTKITCTYRPNEEQDAAFAQGRTEPGRIITNARAGQSPHNCILSDGTPAARAFDFAIIGPDGKCDWDASDTAWQECIKIGESLGLESGSTFPRKDAAHFQIPDWKTAI